MNFIIGTVRKVTGATKDGAFIDINGKYRTLVVVEEDQSYTNKKTGEKKVWMANIPFVFFGKEAERLAQDPDKYLGKMVKVDFMLGGRRWPDDDSGKWYANIGGRFLHSWDGEGLENKEPEDELSIPF